MPIVARSMIDQYGHPVAGATVVIRNSAGELVDTATTNAIGAWTVTIAAGVYFMVYTKGAYHTSRKMYVCPE